MARATYESDEDLVMIIHLTSGSYRPFMKPNNKILHVNRQRNPPPLPPLKYGRQLAQLRRRRRCHRGRAYAPTNNLASHVHHKKINSRVSFAFSYGYGALLGGLFGPRAGALLLTVLLFLLFFTIFISKSDLSSHFIAILLYLTVTHWYCLMSVVILWPYDKAL